MSERDIERLGNRPVRRLQIPDWFAESKSMGKPRRISRKEPEPTLPENSARLHEYTEGTKLGRITFAKNLILTEEIGAVSFHILSDEYRGLLFLHLYSHPWHSGYRRLKNKTAFQVYLGNESIIRKWGIEPGVYYAQRNPRLEEGVKCEYDESCPSRGGDRICKRGGCWYKNGKFDNTKNIWHVGINFNKPIK